MRKQYWENAVPIEQESRIISTHVFDGIRELDNSLPPWWVNMFILTVIWAAIFMFYYHFGGGGPTQAEYYEQEVAEAKKEIAIALAGQSNAVDEANVTALADAGALGEGELIFKNSCVSCHGQSGEGGVGPNMTDEYWIHGGGIKNVFKTIKYGVPEKGMIAWKAQLKPTDIYKVSSYILTLQGTNPPNAKAPQGVKYVPEEESEDKDDLESKDTSMN
jgi:cytochrome c oxidase cbb3-type subunit 3